MIPDEERPTAVEWLVIICGLAAALMLGFGMLGCAQPTAPAPIVQPVFVCLDMKQYDAATQKRVADEHRALLKNNPADPLALIVDDYFNLRNENRACIASRKN